MWCACVCLSISYFGRIIDYHAVYGGRRESKTGRQKRPQTCAMAENVQ